MEAAMKQPQLHDIYFPEKKEKSANLILQQSTDTGTGEMTCYDVAPGIQITYNNLNMDSCFRPLIPQKDFLQIDHCLEGCYECELAGGSVSFLGEGDLSGLVIFVKDSSYLLAQGFRLKNTVALLCS